MPSVTLGNRFVECCRKVVDSSSALTVLYIKDYKDPHNNPEERKHKDWVEDSISFRHHPSHSVTVASRPNAGDMQESNLPHMATKAAVEVHHWGRDKSHTERPSTRTLPERSSPQNSRWSPREKSEEHESEAWRRTEPDPTPHEAPN